MSAPTSWRTALTEATDDGVRIRGYDLRDLVGGVSFAEGILLMARGGWVNTVYGSLELLSDGTWLA